MKTEEFIELVNKERKKRKNNWYGIGCIVEGLQVQIRGYNTWTEYLRIGEQRYNTVMGLNVGQWQREIKIALYMAQGKHLEQDFLKVKVV